MTCLVCVTIRRAIQSRRSGEASMRWSWMDRNPSMSSWLGNSFGRSKSRSPWMSWRIASGSNAMSSRRSVWMGLTDIARGFRVALGERVEPGDQLGRLRDREVGVEHAEVERQHLDGVGAGVHGAGVVVDRLDDDLAGHALRDHLGGRFDLDARLVFGRRWADAAHDVGRDVLGG